MDLTKAQELCIKQFRIHQALWERHSKKHSDLAMAKHYRLTSASMVLYLFIMHPQLYQNATSALQASGKQYPNPLTSTHRWTATNLKFTTILCQQMRKPRIHVELNALGGASCYDPPQFFSSIPITPVTTPPPTAPAPVAPPAIQPIPIQPVAPPQPYIRMQLLSPMQVDPANVPLPTPSTDSDMLPPDQPMPASPRTCAFVKHLQGQIIHQATTGERGRTTTRVSQDLYNALADMFGLPHYPFPSLLLLDPPALWQPSSLVNCTTLLQYHQSLPPDLTHQSQNQAPLSDPSPGTSRTLRIPSINGACNKPTKSTSRGRIQLPSTMLALSQVRLTASLASIAPRGLTLAEHKFLLGDNWFTSIWPREHS